MAFKTTMVIALIFLLFSCKQESKKSNGIELKEKSMTSTLNVENLKWMNQPTAFELNQEIKIKAGAETDFFVNPENGQNNHTAPFLYQEVEGDFVAIVNTQPDFKDMWNAGCLMVYIDSTHWIKYAFERSDATGKSIVSVVTDGVSDDANGVVLEDQTDVWLKLIRKDDIYSMLWSPDGVTYKMSRLTKLPSPPSVKVGLEAQCPVGKGAEHLFFNFQIEKKTVDDLRKGE